MSLIDIQPTFVYPTSRQFPFDSLGARIIGELELRYWMVPGIKIKVDVYGSGKEKFQRISEIEGDEFLLHFDYDGLRQIVIPYKELKVYSDESGPSLRYYVGKNYEKDKEWFKHSIKVNSKLRGEPRRYLRYDGRGHNHRATTLVHDNDLNREYDPEGNEPTSFNVDDVFDEVCKYLEYIIEYILQYPELNYNAIPPVETDKVIPYEGVFDNVYVPIDSNMVRHITKAKAGELIDDKHYYAVSPGRRLCNLNVHGDFDRICYDGFVWADPNITDKEIHDSRDLVEHVQDSQHTLWEDANSVAEVKILYSNGVYVVDDDEFENKRQEFFLTTDRLTDEELDQCYTARAKTLVPINEYKGGYKNPIVLFNREVEFDEVLRVIPYKE